MAGVEVAAWMDRVDPYGRVAKREAAWRAGTPAAGGADGDRRLRPEVAADERLVRHFRRAVAALQ